jgi:cytochrome c
MNTMEITKFVGALCGSLLVFLLISTAGGSIFNTSSDVVAFRIEVEEEDAAPTEGEAEEAVDVAALVAQADPGAGEGVFRRCAACHKVDGSNGVGPHLDGVVGRDIAAVDGFNYSAALAGKEGAWTAEEIYAFIENPRGYAEGTSMAFAGLSSSEDRADVIAYLESVTN